ncbi:MAG: recombinase RecT [Spirochaetaceae bacterium]|jgi:recombination protein RecT|nr:recombinase RecT [Spirochaetaceae bacterium]
MRTDGSDQNTKGRQNEKGPSMSGEDRARKTLQSQIAGMAKEFERALPGRIGAERMMRIVMTAILRNPVLAQCEPQSFFGALLTALQLGLEVNSPLGQAYLIPRKRKTKDGSFFWECNFQMGYQGMLDLCYRMRDREGGLIYKNIDAKVAHEGDYFEFRYGSNQQLTHIPSGQNLNAKPTHVWALYELINGGGRFEVWTWQEAMAHGKEFSDSWDENAKWKSPWLSNDTAQEEMAKKSVLKALLKYAPKSVEVAQAASSDERAVVVDKYDDAEGAHLQFDLKSLPPPDKEAQDFMNQINSVGKAPDKETVPAGKPENSQQEQHTEYNRQEPPRDAASGNGGNGKNGLFSEDEEAALSRRQYEHGQWDGYEGPDFD